MSGHTAQRTLVKSPPELWAELSDAAALAKHLVEFGEIRITRLEPETVVAWEGDRANGTVSLESAGWGTKVTITVDAIVETPVVPAVEPEPLADETPVAPAVEPEPLADETSTTISELATSAEPAASEPNDSEPAAAPALDAPPAPASKPTLFGRLKRWLTPNRDAAIWQLSDELPPQPELDDGPAVDETRTDVDEQPDSEPAPAAPIRLEPRSPDPDPDPPAAAEAQPAALAEEAIAGVLTDVLDTLGAAHHRPFSRG